MANPYLDDPQYALGNLPQLGDYATLQDYLDAVQANYNGNPNLSQPAYAPPTDFTTPDGQQMHAAGYHDTESAGQMAADVYNRKLANLDSQPTYRLALMSRMKLHPEEAQMAYDAYSIDPATGLPQASLDPYLQNLFEQAGFRPTPAPTDPNYVAGPYTRGNRPDRGGDGVTRGGRPDRNRPLDPITTPTGGGVPLSPIGTPTNGNPFSGFQLPPDALAQLRDLIGSNPQFPTLPTGGDFARDTQPTIPQYSELFDGGQAQAQAGLYPDGLLQALKQRRQPIAPKTGY